MNRYEFGDLDDDGEEVAVCPECEGTGRDPDHDPCDDDEPNAGDCPVCCGFGRLDW